MKARELALSRLTRQADLAAHTGAIRVGLQTRGVNAVNGKLFVAIFGVPGHADRSNHFALRVADQHAATFGKDLITACGNQVTHEDRPLLGALANELRAAPKRERGTSFAIGHFEPNHRRPIFFLECFHLAATTITLKGRQLSDDPRAMMASMICSA